MRAARMLKTDGRFDGLADLASFADLNTFMSDDLRARQARGL